MSSELCRGFGWRIKIESDFLVKEFIKRKMISLMKNLYVMC